MRIATELTLRQGASSRALILRHISNEFPDGKEVTCLDWNPDGSILATGSSDGCARLWVLTGDLQSKLVGHNGAIFCVRWNKRGDLLVTGSVDHSAIAWNSATGEPRQIFRFHTGNDAQS